jgi:hypothetical protein
VHDHRGTARGRGHAIAIERITSLCSPRIQAWRYLLAWAIVASMNSPFASA